MREETQAATEAVRWGLLMPTAEWLEGPAWIAAIGFLLWAIVRSVAWALQIRSAIESERQPVGPANGASAEWRGETRQVLKQIRNALGDTSALDRELLQALKAVRDELREHNQAAVERHRIVQEIHGMVSQLNRGE